MPATSAVIGNRDYLSVVLVADLFGLGTDDFAHIAMQFPIYDREAGDTHRYPTLAVQVYERFHADGLEAAECRAAQLAAARASAGVGFGFDELWQPDGGWQRANTEAHEILAALAVA